MHWQNLRALIWLLIVCVLCSAASGGGQQNSSQRPVWMPDNGDGTYKNPIIFADYSDPDVVRVGDDFYMVSSSFSSMPGLPVLHSKDLVNWTLIGHVFQSYPFEAFASPQHGNGVWAPSLRYHKGEFYICFGDPDLGIFMAKAKNPAGPWGRLIRIKEGKGMIDPCPFWDDDGNAYVVHAWAKSRAGYNSILTVARLSADGEKILDDGKTVFDGRVNHPTIEGPKLYKRNGYYYIFAPAGGVATGWQTVLRSKNIYGPYEDRIVLAQGKTDINGPHQGAWVELQSGESWFIHFQDRGAYGRITHLQPLRWVNDWPVIGADPDGDGKGEPVLTHRKPDVARNYPRAVPQTGDEFTAKRIGFQWQWQANYRDDWLMLAARRGWLRLYAVPAADGAVSLWSAPNLLLQKLPAPEFTATARLDVRGLAIGERVGVVVMGMDYSYLAVQKTATGARLVRAHCKDAHTGGKEVEATAADYAGDVVVFRVRVDAGAICRFSHSRDGKEFVTIGEPFKAREGRWIGAKVGLFCLSKQKTQKSGYADIDWFRIEGE